jgi:hypothetical protein
MSLDYKTTLPIVLVGSKVGTTRTSIEMESTYQAESATEATKTIETGGYPKIALDCLYTMGSGETTNSIEIKVEMSPDRTNFYQLVNDDTSGATSTLTSREFTIVGVNASTKAFSLPIDMWGKYMRVSVKETGVSSNKGSVYIEGTLFGK